MARTLCSLGRVLLDLEFAHQAIEKFGLAAERLACGGRFLDHGGVLLGTLIHLIDRDVYLLQRHRLLIGGTGDLRDQIVYFGDAVFDLR